MEPPWWNILQLLKMFCRFSCLSFFKKKKVFRSATHCWQECKMVHSTLENNLAVSCKMKHILTIWPGSCLLNIYPREMKTNVHKKPAHSFVCNSPKLEKTHVFFSRWMVPSYRGILFSNKKEQTMDT